MRTKRTILLMLVIAVLGIGVGIQAQDDMTPSVEVTDQVIVDWMVSVDYAYSPGPGFMVIHVDNNGGPGPVIGYRWVNPGENFHIHVPIDASAATPVMYAMLHEDTGEVGVYEFGTVEGADRPVIVDGAPVTPAFNAAVLNAHDQFLENSTYTAASVTVAEAGFLVIHAGDGESFGAVLGATPVAAGTTMDVSVELSGDITPVLWPMLHVDTGVVGEYEFGSVQGADGPVVINGVVATAPIWTVPHMRVADQIVTHGDGMEMADVAPTVTAQSVLSEGPGWLVIHIDNEGRPGPVAGQTILEPGLNTNVVVELDASMITPVLFPMLHVDSGEAGVYEFGTVEGADSPVRVNDQVVVFPISAAPSIDYSVSQGEEAGTVVVHQALIDAPGWLAIHIDNEGRPGPVAGAAPLLRGLNHEIIVTVDESMITANVFPMLHYDTGEAGVYEFGTVEGADGPVRVGEAVVVGPAEIMMGE